RGRDGGVRLGVEGIRGPDALVPSIPVVGRGEEGEHRPDAGDDDAERRAIGDRRRLVRGIHCPRDSYTFPMSQGPQSATAPAQTRAAWQRQADWTWGMIRRIHLGTRRPANWAQLFQFGVVGAVGYVVNLAVFAVLTLTLDLQGVGRGGTRRVSGDPLLRRQPGRARGQPGGAGTPGGRPRGARASVAG